MSDTVYCYHCGRSHPKEEMRRVQTKTGSRWRCIKSVLATRRSVAERDAFGKRVTEINTAERRAQAIATRQMVSQLDR